MGDRDGGGEELIARARSWIDQSERVVVLTGAGISTDSGIPDFRGPQGVWTKDPLAEKMSNIQHYIADPALRVRAWQSRLETVARLGGPNAGHRALVELERRGKLQLLITQNIDGLHADAGVSPDRIVEIHGTFREVVCLSCGERNPISHAFDRVRAGEADPACQSCGGILKSATISFGQSLVEADLARSAEAAESCDLMLAVGSTLSVFPAANMVPIAKNAGARIVILNAEPTEMDSLADAVIHDSISAVLPSLVEALN